MTDEQVRLCDSKGDALIEQVIEREHDPGHIAF